MIIKKFLVYIVAASMVMSAFVVLYAAGASNAPLSSSGDVPVANSIAWTGTVTINPDGSISDSAAPISFTGDLYSLTGDINGSVTIERSNTVFEGNGYNITGDNGVGPMQLNSANNITLMNTNLSATWSPAVGIYLSSYDTVVNNTILGMNSGIYVNAPYNRILNNTVSMTNTDPTYTGSPAGISTYGSDTTIMGNSVYIPRSSTGIVLDAQKSTVSDNTVSVSGDSSSGMFSASSSNSILDNSVTSNGTYSYGLQLNSGFQFSTVTGNTVNVNGNYTNAIAVGDGLNDITANTVTAYGNFSKGIYVPSSGSGSDMISGNTVYINGSNSAAVYSNSYNTTIQKNTINAYGNSTYGIDVITLTLIDGNSVHVIGTKAYGIYSSFNDRAVTGNIVLVEGFAVYGLYISEGSYLTVSYNDIQTSGNHGNATTISGVGNTVEGNTITGELDNGTGINFLKYTDNNNITGNTVYNSSVGFRTAVTSGNVFVGNTFENDTSVFKLTNTNTNLLYHNNFLNY